MRTAISIPDDLHAEAKTRAARAGLTLSQVVEDALRTAFATREAGTARPVVRVHRVGRVASGVDLDDSPSMLDAMDGDGSSLKA